MSTIDEYEGMSASKIRWRTDANYRATIIKWRKTKMDTDPAFRARMNELKRESRKRCKERRLTEAQTAQQQEQCAH